MLKRSLILLAVFSSLAGCFGAPGAGPHWKDGNYCVYSRPVSRDIIMGYYMGGGSILGLSEPTVTAAGADSRYVVFKREGGVTEYYYIEK